MFGFTGTACICPSYRLVSPSHEPLSAITTHYEPSSPTMNHDHDQSSLNTIDQHYETIAMYINHLGLHYSPQVTTMVHPSQRAARLSNRKTRISRTELSPVVADLALMAASAEKRPGSTAARPLPGMSPGISRGGSSAGCDG